MSGLRPVFFRKPDLIPPKQAMIQQGGIVRAENQLCAILIDFRIMEHADQTPD